MNAALSSQCSERSLIGAFFETILSSFRRSSSEHITRLAASIAAELRNEPGAADLVLAFSSQTRSARTSGLLEAARYLRGDWSTFGIADSLRRLTRTDLFFAVVRELQKSETTRPTSPEDYYTPHAHGAKCTPVHMAEVFGI